MLLELFELDKGLRGAGIAVGLSDNRIQSDPKRPALEARVDRAGRVVCVSVLPMEGLEAIRKFESSTGGMRESTPGFNVDPLYRRKTAVDEDTFNSLLKDLKKEVKSPDVANEKRRVGLERARSMCEPNWDFSKKSKINLCLVKAAGTLREKLSAGTKAELKPLIELLRRSESLDGNRLHEGVSLALVDSIVEGRAAFAAEHFLKMFFSNRGKSTTSPTNNQSFSLILELHDTSDFGGLANHEAVWRAVNAHLIQSPVAGQKDATGKKKVVGTEDRAGIFGDAISASLGAMPERNLPRLGKVKIFSLSAQTPCQGRYGLIESAACPVGLETQGRLAAALQWITEKEREGKTWANVSDSCGYEQPALLVAYAEGMPSVPPNFAALFAPSPDDNSSDGYITESRFEVRSASLIRALQGIQVEDRNPMVSVLVITKADKARKKLLYSRQFSIERLIEASREWQTAARNYPDTGIRSFDLNRKPVWKRPLIPHPSELVRVVNTYWNSDGLRPKMVSNARIGLGLGLMLETGPSLDQIARETIRLLVRSVAPLILALGHSHSEGKALLLPTKFQDIPLLIPATLGLILAKAGHLKGDYMSANPYLIGRLLSVEEYFHRSYCEHVRNDQRPGRLVGNVLMPTALENPMSGLARLAERMCLYQSVAPGELRAVAGDIERQIDKNALKSSSTEEEKAQMLLGYLARPGFEESASSENRDTTGENA